MQIALEIKAGKLFSNLIEASDDDLTPDSDFDTMDDARKQSSTNEKGDDDTSDFDISIFDMSEWIAEKARLERERNLASTPDPVWKLEYPNWTTPQACVDALRQFGSDHYDDDNFLEIYGYKIVKAVALARAGGSLDDFRLLYEHGWAGLPSKHWQYFNFKFNLRKWARRLHESTNLSSEEQQSFKDLVKTPGPKALGVGDTEEERIQRINNAVEQATNGF